MLNCLYKKSILGFIAGLIIINALGQSSAKRKEINAAPQRIIDLVNVFLGSSGDHGQISPAASYPFSFLSIGPQTYPGTHTGYEYLAKQFLGFTHNRMEGVGCQGSGGNIFVKPFVGADHQACMLEKQFESAGAGFYQVGFKNNIQANFAVYQNSGVHYYAFPQGEKGLFIDLGFAFNNAFVDGEHEIKDNILSGWLTSKTTCHAGVYKVFYALRPNQNVQWKEVDKHKVMVIPLASSNTLQVNIRLSSVSTAHAISGLVSNTFDELKSKSQEDWNQLLSQIMVRGEAERAKLFYSLFYRVVQSPYVISEHDGKYRTHNGELGSTTAERYNGWAIWDNYKTQLPLFSFLFPDRYQHMINSIANLYPYNKKDFATKFEPSNTVRTEHAIVVLWDAYTKGYRVNFDSIKSYLIKEVDGLDFSKPDKALESSYDTWALSKILGSIGDKELSEQYLTKAKNYKTYWEKDFKDLGKSDIDRMGARNMYQGTIWQYRWAVPFDIKGLIALTGGEEEFVRQLDQFFDNDYYNRSNEPDLQVPAMYGSSIAPWKAQALMHRFALDTIIHHYFNDNSRGIGSYIGPIYQNRPNAFLRTMDDDAGAMSGWFVLAACGIYPASIGHPIYYLSVPFFEEMIIRQGKGLRITVKNFGDKNVYIQKVQLNGQELNRNWISHKELMEGGVLQLTASDTPNKQQDKLERWISSLE
jgi:putative alpha-1,2-mannosidase